MGSTQTASAESRVAVLVDCDNTSPEILEHALKVVAQFGRVVRRRSYGTHTIPRTGGRRRLAAAPCLK